MQFYLATSFIFPRSLRLRLFAVCFVATHLPLLCYIGWGAATGRLALAEVVMLTLATVAGTGLTWRTRSAENIPDRSWLSAASSVTVRLTRSRWRSPRRPNR